ncbi:lipoprotein Spr [Filimonas lacunae]|uniref:Lipoprotein Spr n=1 Tax=Filimonas lacunae TaxID=477680 RepID=A0A173ML06_9BACT|nr:NlpC/P60 family protein [Filimonas lacunae]BAV08081.1 lipoprotein NlpC precursor [Filimonas lacunae]SIT09015.1 lipoprotein Spr [Filimonas lacunae]
MVIAVASCKSIKNIGAKDNSTAKSSKSSTRTRSGSGKFIDGIEVTPGSVVTSKHATSSSLTGKKGKLYQPEDDVPASGMNIEEAQWLQLKFAIILDASVEKLTNMALLRSLDEWWGTRYCLGGNTQNCVDCSGFTLAVMRDVYGVSVPRTAQEQYDKSARVDMEDLREGDYVFFHTSGRSISHVGIYLFNNKFVHASTSNGVMVSDLNDKYWQPKYRGGGRVTRK